MYAQLCTQADKEGLVELATWACFWNVVLKFAQTLVVVLLQLEFWGGRLDLDGRSTAVALLIRKESKPTKTSEQWRVWTG